VSSTGERHDDFFGEFMEGCAVKQAPRFAAAAAGRPAIVRAAMSARRRLFAVMVVMTLAQATAACGGLAPGIHIGTLPGPVFGTPSSHAYEPPPTQEAKRARWSADRGDPDGQNKLGGYYEIGYGVAKDYVQADMSYILAAAAGNDRAPENRDHIETLMTPGQIAEARRLASEWKPNPTPLPGARPASDRPK
jgi:hypothetical protein